MVKKKKKKCTRKNKGSLRCKLNAFFHKHLRDRIIPHEGNNYIPHALRHRALLSYSAVLVSLKIAVVTIPLLFPFIQIFASDVSAQNIIALTNQTRKEMGVRELVENPLLTEAANKKAQDMLLNNYFAHTSPYGLDPWYWIHGAGYDYRYAGENLAVHFTTSEGIRDAWMANPTHRQNMINDKYSEIGIGIAKGRFEGYDTILVVQMFGHKRGVDYDDVNTDAGTTETELTTSLQTIDQNWRNARDFAAVLGESTGNEPIINLNTFSIHPQGDTYVFEVEIYGASQASATLNSSLVKLEDPDEDNIWQGTMEDFDAKQQNDAMLFITAVNPEGKAAVEEIVRVIPDVDAHNLSLFADQKVTPMKLFGMATFNKFQDFTQAIFFLAAFLIALHLIIKILVNAHVQRHSIIAHALAVFILSLILTIL